MGKKHLTTITYLVELVLSNNVEITNDGVSYLGSRTCLRYLGLQRFKGVTDVNFVERLPNLTQLNLKFCRSITDEGVCCLGSLTRLRNLYV